MGVRGIGNSFETGYESDAEKERGVKKKWVSVWEEEGKKEKFVDRCMCGS